MKAARRDGLRVLVVEDESMVATMLETALADAGYLVIGPVPTVSAAMSLIGQQEQIDAALLDVQLGRQRVFPVADALAERGVPLVFLSGYGAQVLPQQYQDRPVLPKPYRLTAMLEQLDAVIEENGALRTAKL